MYAVVSHPVLDELHRPFVAHVVEKAADVRIEYPVHFLPLDAHSKRVKRLMRAAARTEPVGEALEVDLVYLIEDRHHGLLDEFVLTAAMPNGRCRPSAFGIKTRLEGCARYAPR